MGRAHGFRVFILETFHNRVKGKDPLATGVGSETADELLGLLNSLAARGTVFFDPPVPDADSDEPPRRPVSVTIHDPIAVRDDLVHFVLSHGERGERPTATHPEKAPQSLEEYSAEGEHFMAIQFSTAAEETRFVVVAQTINRRDAVGLLERVLKLQSFDDRRAAEQAQKQARQDAIAAGEKPARNKAFHRLVFTRRQAADNAYLNEIVGNAKNATIEFEQRVPAVSERSGDGEQVRRKLQIRLLTEEDREISSDVSKGWLARQLEGKAPSHKEGVAQMASELEDHDLMEGAEAEDYNRVSISLTAKDRPGTRIAVDTIKDVFTYPVSDGPPTPYQHYKKVEPRIQTIAAEEGVELDDLNAMEIDQCLPG